MSGRQIALCGVLSALAATVLLSGGMVPGATFCAPVLAMVALLPVLEECGSRAALTAWTATSLLGILLSPDRELALVYAFFGWYPVVRTRISRIPGKFCSLAAKLVLCNAIIFSLYGAVLGFLGLTADLDGAGRPFKAALLVLANVSFLALDAALERMTLLWRRRLRRRFFR